MRGQDRALRSRPFRALGPKRLATHGDMPLGGRTSKMSHRLVRPYPVCALLARRCLVSSRHDLSKMLMQLALCANEAVTVCTVQRSWRKRTRTDLRSSRLSDPSSACCTLRSFDFSRLASWINPVPARAFVQKAFSRGSNFRCTFGNKCWT